MRVFVHLCIVSFALLALSFCTLAQPELAPMPPRVEKQELPKPPWLTIIRPADREFIAPPIPAGARVEIEPFPACFRILRLRFGTANEIMPFFSSLGGAPAAAMEQFLPRGVRFSRAGDNVLLVTAVDEESLDQAERLVGLFDKTPRERPHLILEIMLVDSPREVRLPAIGEGPLMDELAVVLRRPDVTIYRTFLDIWPGQQGVLDLEPCPLPARALLFSEAMIHPNDVITLTMRALPRKDGPDVPKGSLLTVKNGSALLLNTLLPAMQPVRDEAANPHHYYLIAGLNACRDDPVHLADGTRPLRIFYDGARQPQLISLRNISIQALLPRGEWLEDTVTPPASWPQGLPPFAASPGLNALLATGNERENEALREFIAGIDVPQLPLVVEGQFIRISEEALRRHFGVERAEGGAWPLPNADARLRDRIAEALQNDAKMVMTPRLTVAPFGAGGVAVDDWGLEVEQACTRADGAVSLQLAPLLLPDSIAGNRQLPPLVLQPGKPTPAAIFSIMDTTDVLLFVVSASPQRVEEIVF